MKKHLAKNPVKWIIAVFLLMSFLTHLPETIQGIIEGWNSVR